MAGKDSQDTAAKLERVISIIKYILFCMDILSFILGFTVFCLCVWVRFDGDTSDWIDKLNIYGFYVGLYVLLLSSLIVMIIAVIGCFSALTENAFFLLINAIAQMVSFLIKLIGAAILMDYSTTDSSIKPAIRSVMLDLITRYPREDFATGVLSLIQENVGCCGADGPNDYVNLLKPLPTECRDTVTGNAFFYGCSDEMTWYLGAQTIWITWLAIGLCFLNVMNAVLSLILLQAIRKEEYEAVSYKR